MKESRLLRLPLLLVLWWRLKSFFAVRTFRSRTVLEKHGIGIWLDDGEPSCRCTVELYVETWRRPLGLPLCVQRAYVRAWDPILSRSGEPLLFRAYDFPATSLEEACAGFERKVHEVRSEHARFEAWSENGGAA